MVILPHSRFLQRWNILLLLVILWYCFSIPTSFVLPEKQIDFFGWIDLIACLVLLGDVLVNMHKAVLVEGEVVTDLKEIRKRYFKSGFTLDLLASGMFLDLITWGWLMDEKGHFAVLWLVLRHIKLLKILNISKIYGRIMNSSSVVQMLLFIIWIFVSINAIACGWMMIYPYRECAVVYGGLEPSGWANYYIRAVYWAVTTLTTVGYGDISPARSDNGAMIYTLCVMLVGAGAFAFVIGNIATLLVNANVHKSERRKKLKALATFMKHYEISDELQHNLYNFYNHELAHSLSDSDAEIIDKLPPKLQETLRRHISCHTLARVDLFSMASEEELATLGQRLQTVVFSPGDEIISIGTPGREMYFITHGVVEVLSAQGARVAKMYSNGFFGEVALISDVQRTATVRALTFCNLYVLKKVDFQEIISANPHLRKSIYTAARQRFPNINLPE